MRHLTSYEKIEVAEYVLEVLDQTKAGSGNHENEHGSWIERARDLLKKRAAQFLKTSDEFGSL